MKVRVSKLRIWHLPYLIRTFVHYRASCEDVVLFGGSSASIFAVAARAVGGLAPESHIFAAWVGGDLIGLALAEFAPDRRRANVLGLTVLPSDHGGTDGSDGIAAGTLLLEHVAIDAAERGYVSIFLRLPRKSRFLEPFAKIGFVSAVSEDEYVRQLGPIADPEPIEGLRLIEQADAWDLAQLYRTITPAALQLAEGSDGYGLFAPRAFVRIGLRRRRADQYVVAGDRGLDGWLSVKPDDHGRNTILMMVHPRHSSLTPKLLSFAMWTLRRCSPLPTLVVVHSHEDVLRRAVEAEGFERTDTRELLVKHLAVRISEPIPAQMLDRATS